MADGPQFKHMTNSREQEVFNKFCDLNKKFWLPKKSPDDSGSVLVEGLFAESGPNYVIRIGIITKAIEEVTGYNSLVLLQKSANEESNKVKIWGSFGFQNFIGIYGDIYEKFSPLKKTLISIIALLYYHYSQALLLFCKKEMFAKIKFKGFEIGDFLYDEIIKENEYIENKSNKEYTINKIQLKHKKFFLRAFVYFFASEFIYKKFRPKYYVTTHSQYISYGLPTRYFAYKKIPVIETTDDFLFIYDDPSLYPPKFHNAVKTLIKKELSHSPFNKERQELVTTQLNNRFSGKANQIDAQMAYANKHNYSKQELSEKLGINNNHPFVFIFAHVFADSPRGLSDGMLFADFYEWLYQTINYIKNIKDVNWIIKPHPSVKTYGESGEVEKIVKELCGTPESSVFICPENFSTAGVLECAKAIVTAQGTVGVEFSCMGIPIIISGKPFYSGFGFTNEPKTKTQYFKQLRDIKSISNPTPKQIEVARSVYFGFYEVQNKDFSLIDSLLKDKTWGCGCEQDILGAFELMTERLENIDPKQTTLYQQIKSYVEKEKLKNS